MWSVQAADFLQDAETESAITEIFSQIFVPYSTRALHSTHWKKQAPNSAQRDRACQVHPAALAVIGPRASSYATIHAWLG